MAGKVTLSRELGEQITNAMIAYYDKELPEAVQTAYNAVLATAEGTNPGDSFKEKFMNFQDIYNGSVIATMNKLKAELDKFSDAADYMKNMDVDTSVKDVDTGTVKDTGFDAMTQL